jgi:hypothetical protein
MDNNKNLMSNNPYAPSRQQHPQSYQPFFSKEWRQQNPWMEGIDDDYNGFDKTRWELRDSLDAIKKDSEVNETKRVGICINFGDGIPLDNFIEKEIEKVAIMKKKASDLAVFNEMMRESKGISRVVRNYNK